jgi:hypothetical protein
VKTQMIRRAVLSRTLIEPLADCAVVRIQSVPFQNLAVKDTHFHMSVPVADS